MSFVKWLDKNFEAVCLAALLIVMTVLSFTNVIMRYCFKSALSWSDEVCCYCLALSAFFSLPCSIRYRTTIKVDTLVALFPAGMQKVLSCICNIIMMVFLGFCVKGGLDVAATAAGINQRSPALQIPVSNLYYITTFCFVLAILRSVQILVMDLKGTKEEGE